MITYLGYKTLFTIKEYGELELEVMVENRSGKLNAQTGFVMSRKDLADAVEEIITNVYNNKSLMDIKGLGYIPHTFELLAHRLWEDIEDRLGFEATMGRLKVSHGNYFVVYDGRRDHKSKRKRETQETN